MHIIATGKAHKKQPKPHMTVQYAPLSKYMTFRHGQHSLCDTSYEKLEENVAPCKV